MANIIHIETSTHVCSVAISVGGENIFSICSVEPNAHSSKLGVFIDQAVSKLEQLDIVPDAVAVSCGPGSYTGLRIGISTAKGLCFGFGIPLIALDTLKIIAYTVAQNHTIQDNHLICAMIDARRMEVYMSIYDKNLNQKQETSATIIEENCLLQMLDSNIIWFVGNGAEKCKPIINHANSRYIDHIDPLAINMATMAEYAYNASDFQNVAYYEPHYLKEFVITQSKKNPFLPK